MQTGIITAGAQIHICGEDANIPENVIVSIPKKNVKIIQTITINGQEIEAPLQEVTKGQFVYTFTGIFADGVPKVAAHITRDVTQWSYELQAGTLFRSHEAAVAYARALLK